MRIGCPRKEKKRNLRKDDVESSRGKQDRVIVIFFFLSEESFKLSHSASLACFRPFQLRCPLLPLPLRHHQTNGKAMRDVKIKPIHTGSCSSSNGVDGGGEGLSSLPSNDQFSSKSPQSSSMPLVKASPRNASSKYDFVKVKVWLGDNADHYYVLSRFLLSRTLTVTKIPNHVAIKIALELKKLLIDNSLLDVSQSDLEANLFKLMERRGYGEEYINRYKMMTRFHHQRVPLVILVCGTACVGKSTIATQLAQRLNLPNVLQTDMVYELLRTSTDAPLASTPVWARDFNSSEELITEFCRECRVVRKGLAGDLKKAMKDGKPIIIEGIHLDPSIYLMDEENKSPTAEPEKPKESNPLSLTSDDDPTRQDKNDAAVVSGSHNGNSPGHEISEEGKSGEQVNKVSDTQGSEPAVNITDSTGETFKDPEKESNTSAKKEKSGAEPIIVPIVLKMAEFDHVALLEEWISTRTSSDKYPVQGLKVVNISATTFPQTLDWLHGYLLQCIEQGISSVSNENSMQPAEK